MADAGLQVVSSQGVVQIDSSYRNLHLIGKQDSPHYYDRSTDRTRTIPVYMPQFKDSIIAYSIDPWYQDEYPIPESAVTQPRDYNGYVHWGHRITQPMFRFYGHRSYDAHLYDSSFRSGEVFASMSSASMKLVDIRRPSSGPVPVYETVNFGRDKMPQPQDNINFSIYEFNFVDLKSSSSKFGMQVFNQNSEVVFDSSFKPMKVVKFFECPVLWRNLPREPLTDADPIIWELPKSTDGVKRKYAIAPLDAPFRFTNEYKGGYYNVNDYVTSSGSSSVDGFQFQDSRILHYPMGVSEFVKSEPGRHLYTGMNTINYLLLDVTGY